MIVLNGRAYDGSEAPFDLSDRGLMLGDGLFETMTLFGGTIFRLDDHLRRLQHGISVLGFSVPRDRLEADLMIAGGHEPPDGAVVRLTVTRGGGVRGLAMPAEPNPTVIVSLSPFRRDLVGEPTSLYTASVRRSENSPLSRLKTLGYLDNILALREAAEHGHKDALILNNQLRVACSSVANVFAVTDGKLLTPPIRDGVLPGIIRGLVLALAPEIGLQPVERSLTVRDLIQAGQVFLTNSVRLVQPVTAIDNSRLPPGDAEAGAVLARLIEAIVEECGVDPVGA
ncbi:aminotransferase class IV [Chthonobacter albigriseus]|uniref:aminotransferase class IV n=1 Tax=Chthonobacter albigriseus TaxID=1683161 RepID=UPI0015EF2D12|nr:aminotransferase class IV [Chthonobacter albigriseus]